MKHTKTTLLASTVLAALAVAPALTLVTPTVAVAQDLVQGAVSGTVETQSETPIAGATVTLQSVSQGFTRSYTTDASGSFRAIALPQGRYTATITAPGFDSLTDTISVGSGGTTSVVFTVGNASGASTVDDIVVVGVRQAISEFDATTTGLTVNVEELSRNVPIARDAGSVALLAPGVTASDNAFGGIPTIGGSSAGENTYFINGLNITKFREFTGSSTVPFEFYQTLETKTGGYSAEFGRGTGGVLNGTTKSGGNEWEFGITAYWEPDTLRSDSPDTYLAQNHFDEVNSSDIIVDFGGPIIPDRLFIFGLVDFRDREFLNIGAPTVDPAFGPGANGARVTSDDPFYGAKVDYLINDDHRLEFTYFSDEQTQETNSIFVNTSGNYVGEFTPSSFKFGGENWIARYTGIWTDWLTTSVAYGVNQYNEARTSPGDDCAYISSTRPSDPRRGCWGSLTSQVALNDDQRTVFRADVDIYADFLGAHHFRLGIDNETLESYQELDYSGSGYSYCRPGGFTPTISCTGDVTGGIWYRYQNHFSDTNFPAGRPDLEGSPRRVRIRAYDNDGGWKSTQNAFYIQDSWQLTDQLTLNLGVRNEGFENENLAGVAFVDLQNQWAPRLGFTYDVTGDRTSKLFGFYGRYFLPVAVNTNQRLAGAEFYISDTWNLDLAGGPNDANADGIDDTTGEPILGTWAGASTFADGALKPIATQVDKNLDPMYVDEFILGYQQELWDGWTVGVTGTYRELGKAIDDVAIDAAVLAYCDTATDLDAAICDNVWYGYHQYVLTNPGEDMVITLSGADLTAADAGPGGMGRTFDDREITLSAADLGYPTPDRVYRAVEVSMEKSFDGIWGARFSYVWSESEGNYEGALKSDNGQTDPGLSQDFDQPGLTDNAYGLLPNHRAHTFKAYGNWQVSPAFNIGANLIIQSPRKFGCIGEHATDDFAYQYANASWFCDLDGNGTLEPSPRGSQFESDWLKNLDLTFAFNLSEVFTIPGDSLVLRADVFNVFGFEAETDYNEYGTLGDITGTGFIGVDPNLPSTLNPNYGRPTSYQAPRSVRLSLAYRF